MVRCGPAGAIHAVDVELDFGDRENEAIVCWNVLRGLELRVFVFVLMEEQKARGLVQSLAFRFLALGLYLAELGDGAIESAGEALLVEAEGVEVGQFSG